MGHGERLIGVNREDAQAKLLELRAQIDATDDKLLDMLVERFKITRQVGEMKRDAGLPPADPNREAQMYERLRSHASDRGLDPDTIEDVYRALLSHVVRQHQSLRS